MKHVFVFLLSAGFFATAAAQNVGIGTSLPNHKLDVVGSIHSSTNGYFDNAIGINTTNILSSTYKLQVNNGAIALYNTNDLKTWYFNYSSASNYFYLSEGGTSRLVVANGGNVGIGNANPSVKLDVSGSLNVVNNVTVGGVETVAGDIVVNGNKGIVRSTNGTQLKYYSQQAAFYAVGLPAFGTSVQVNIAWAAGLFNNPPKVMVGDIVTTGGTLGQLWRLQLIPYGVTATGCKAVIINTSNAAVNYDVTWNIICIGN